MRKEKYIQQGEKKKGKYLRVYIKYKDGLDRKTYSKYFYLDDYSSPKIAMTAAKMDRDKFLHALESGVKLNTKTKIEDLYDMEEKIFTTTVTTRERHDTFFNNALTSFKGKYIEDITAPQIQAHMNEYAQNHSDDSISRMMTLWKRLYQTAQIHDLDVRDQSVKLVKPKSKKVKKSKQVTISDADFQRFLDALLVYNLSSGEQSKVSNKTVWYFLQIMYHTGMRPGEVYALTKDDIIPQGIIVNKQIGSTATHKQQVIPPKTEQSNRIVPISPQLRPLLNELVKDSKYSTLLTDRDGNPLDTDYISNHISLVSKACKIPFHSYMLRHKFSSDMLLSGVDVRTTQDLMGHANLSQTVDYARSSEESREEAIKNRN